MESSKQAEDGVVQPELQGDRVSSTAEPYTLMTIPRELRVRILEFLVQDFQPEIRVLSWIPWKTKVNFKTSYNIIRRPSKNIVKQTWDVLGPLLLSAELRDEFLEALGKAATFAVHPATLHLLSATGTDFTHKIVPSYSTKIQSIQMQLSLGMPIPPCPGLCFSRSFPSLRRLNVSGRYAFRLGDIGIRGRHNAEVDAHELAQSARLVEFCHREHDRVLQALCHCAGRKFRLNVTFAVGSFSAFFKIVNPDTSEESFVDFFKEDYLRVTVSETPERVRIIESKVNKRFDQAVELRDSGKAHVAEWRSGLL